MLWQQGMGTLMRRLISVGVDWRSFDDRDCVGYVDGIIARAACGCVVLAEQSDSLARDGSIDVGRHFS
jgi:hypothetical protein